MVGLIARTGERAYRHHPAFAIPTRTIPLLTTVPFEIGTIHEVPSFGSRQCGPIDNDDRKLDHCGSRKKQVDYKIVPPTIPQIVLKRR